MFYLLDLLIIARDVLKSSAIMADVLTSSYSSTNFCFVYVEIILFRNVMPS